MGVLTTTEVVAIQPSSVRVRGSTTRLDIDGSHKPPPPASAPPAARDDLAVTTVQSIFRGKSARQRLRLAGLVVNAAVPCDRHERKDLETGAKRPSVLEGMVRESEAAHGGGAPLKHGRGSCHALTCIALPVETLLERVFHSLGFWIGGHPLKAFLLGWLVLIAGLPGIALLKGDDHVLFLTLDTNFLTQFSLSDHAYYADYAKVSGVFHPGRAGLFIATPTDGASALSAGFLSKLLEIRSHVYTEVRGYDGGRAYSFEDLCARNAAGECASRASGDLLGVLNVSSQADVATLGADAAGRMAAVASVTSALFPSGGVNTSGLLSVLVANSSWERGFDDWVPAATSITTHVLLAHDAVLEAAARDWEANAIKYLTERGHAHATTVRVSALMESSVGKELAQVTVAALPLIAITLFLMISYANAFLATQTRIPDHTQLLLVGHGALIPAFAGVGAFGWCGYFGLRINVICILGPFLVLACGIDCTFVFVSAMKAVGHEQTSYPKITAMSVAEGAGAITTTTATSVVAFLVAAATSTNMPGFFSFNICLALALFLNWVGFVLLFPAMQVSTSARTRRRPAPAASAPCPPSPPARRRSVTAVTPRRRDRRATATALPRGAGLQREAHRRQARRP